MMIYSTMNKFKDLDISSNTRGILVICYLIDLDNPNKKYYVTYPLFAVYRGTFL